MKASGSRISFVTSKLPKKTCTNTEDMKPHRRSHSRFTPRVYSWGANHQAIMLVLHMKYINLYLGTKAGKVLYKSLKNCSTVRLRNKTGLDTLVWVSLSWGNSDPPSWSKNSGTILLTPNGTLFSGRVALLCLIHLCTLTCWFGLLCFFQQTSLNSPEMCAVEQRYGGMEFLHMPFHFCQKRKTMGLTTPGQNNYAL